MPSNSAKMTSPTANREFERALQLQKSGQLASAESLYKTLLRTAPPSITFTIYFNLGLIARAQGNANEAITRYGMALAIVPGSSAALNNLGDLFDSVGRSEDAFECFRKAVEADPNLPEALYNLANAERSRGRFQEAVALYRRALVVNPSYFKALMSLGATLLRQGQAPEAIDAYRRAIAINPRFGEAFHNLSIALSYLGRILEAIDCSQRAVDLGFRQALGTLIKLKHDICDWSNIRETEQLLLKASEIHESPFLFLLISHNADEQLKCARNWAERYQAPKTRLRSLDMYQAKISIGYASADFQEHPMSHLMAEVFELHDRSGFEIVAYSLNPDDGGMMRRRLLKGFDRFVDISQMSYKQASSIIASDGIEILVDLAGYTRGSRTEIFAQRPAPIQVNYLGYPGTMGASFIDYIIADDFVIPEGAEPYYSEKIVRLPNCYLPNDRKKGVARALKRSAYCLPEDAIVFCCFNQVRKICPEIFRAWTEVMRTIEGSVLWLLDDHALAVENLRKEAEAQGVTRERLIFAPRINMTEHLARYKVADLALDTFPYNSHTTASDALWVGCPLATIAGETFASRVAGSLLNAAGLEGFICRTMEEYVRLLKDLATAPEKLQQARRHLHSSRDHTVLFDTSQFVRDLELAYLEISEIGRAGGAPRHVNIRRPPADAFF
jgi:protein O-GlcNAc transferase